MKKIGVLLLVLVILTTGIVNAVPSPEDLQNDNVVQGVNQLNDAAGRFGEEDRWEYISNEWQKFFLQNKGIAAVDGFLTKISIVFKVLFGEDYSLSLILFFVIVLWVVLFSMFYKTISAFSTFSEPVSFGVSFILVIILAHLKALNFLATVLMKLIFFREGVWGWVSFAIFVVVIFLLLKYFKSIIWRIGRSFKKSQEEKAKWDEKFQRELIGQRIDSMQQAFDTINEGFNS